MYIIETRTGKKLKIKIHLVEKNDYKFLTSINYFFNWKEEKKREVYKLQIVGDEYILGVVSIERIPEEYRIHIRLISVSVENKGANKLYKNIIGNLIAHVSKIALQEYAELACVSLKPKSEIVQHYIDKYNMNKTGLVLSIELREIIDLINKYDHD